MNIIHLQDQLKGLPDNTLAGYVQNPTGEVPTYLALSELQRRKTMREKYQQEQAPQTTVAEDMTQEAAPQPQGLAAVAPQPMPAQAVPAQAPQGMAEGGVAQLDTGDMYNEENFATGGIVAFQKGGYSYDPETDNPDEYASMLDQRLAAENDRYRIETPEYGLHPLLGMEHRKKQNEIYKTNPTPFDKAIEYYDSINQPGAAMALESKKREWLYNKDKRDVTTKGISSLDATKSTDTQDAANPAAKDGKGGYSYQPGESATKSASDTYFDTLRSFMPKTSAADGIKTDRLTHDPSLFSRGLENPDDAFAAGTKRYEEYMGPNTALTDAEKRLALREEKLKGRDNQNTGFSLLAAGAEMMNARTLGEGLSRAAKTGLSSYVEGRDKLDAIRDKIDSTKMELALAQRAEKTNMFKYGDDDRRTAKAAQVAAAKEDKLRGLHVQEFNINQKNKEKELGMQGELIDIKRMDLAKDIAYGNRQLSLYEDRFKLADDATKVKMAQIKSNAVKEANKYVLGNPPEVRALVKEFENKGMKTYGNPEFDGRLNLIKNNLVGMYLNQAGLAEADGPAVPNVSDLLKNKQTTN